MAGFNHLVRESDGLGIWSFSIFRHVCNMLQRRMCMAVYWYALHYDGLTGRGRLFSPWIRQWHGRFLRFTLRVHACDDEKAIHHHHNTIW